MFYEKEYPIIKYVWEGLSYTKIDCKTSQKLLQHVVSFPPGVWRESADRKVTQKAVISPEEQAEAATDIPTSS